MRSVNLLPNEGIVAQFDSVRCESPYFKGCESGELTFTTMSLIFSYTQVKVFGKDIEHTFLWALHDIKVVDGRPQLIIDKGDAHQCDILLRKGKLELRMDSHADLVTLANGINKLITGNDEDIVGAPKAFGLRNTANPKSAESKMVSRACAGCGAPLHGRQGTSVTCEYCGRSEQL